MLRKRNSDISHEEALLTPAAPIDVQAAAPTAVKPNGHPVAMVLSIGLILAWVSYGIFPSIFSFTQSDRSALSPLLGGCIVLAVLLLSLLKIRLTLTVLRSRIFLLCAGLCYLALQGCMLAGLLEQDSLFIATLTRVLCIVCVMACGTVVVLRLSHLNGQRLLLTLLLGFALAGCLDAGLVFCPAAISSIIGTLVLPFCVTVSSLCIKRFDLPEAASQNFTPDLLRIALFLFLYEASSFTFLAPVDFAPDGRQRIFLGFTLIAVVFIATLLLSIITRDDRRLGSVALFRTFFLFVIISLIAAPLLRNPTLNVAALISSCMLCHTLAVYFAVDYAREQSLSPFTCLLVCFAVLLAIDTVSVSLCIPLGSFLSEGSPALQNALLFFVLVVLLIAHAAIFTERDAYEMFEQKQDMTIRELIQQRCEAVAAHYGLTDKELEVLMYVSQGRSAPYISKHLYMSTSAVNMRIHGIYSKLNVHSKQEALDLIENFRG